jgi:hypothetical protein
MHRFVLSTCVVATVALLAGLSISACTWGDVIIDDRCPTSYTPAEGAECSAKGLVCIYDNCFAVKCGGDWVFITVEEAEGAKCSQDGLVCSRDCSALKCDRTWTRVNGTCDGSASETDSSAPPSAEGGMTLSDGALE